MSYTVSLGMDKMTSVVHVLLEIAQNQHEEVAPRLLAIQLLMILTGHELGEVVVP